MTGSPRALMPDYLRLVALFGIVVVNVQFIAFSALHGIADPVAETAIDAVTGMSRTSALKVRSR